MFKFSASILCLLLQATLTFSYVSKCVHSGPKCSDCENLKYCVKNETGFETHHITFCNNSMDWYCSSQYGGCVNDSKVCKIFGLQSMECQMQGIFPDPYDCTAYHMCILTSTNSFTSVRGNCPEYRSFDPLTGSCRFPPNHPVCKNAPVPKYDLIPWLFKCRPGEVYEAKNKTCEQSEQYSYTGCVGAGRFADPHDATKYYDCRDEKSVAHFSCPPNKYYNQEIQECISVNNQ